MRIGGRGLATGGRVGGEEWSLVERYIMFG